MHLQVEKVSMMEVLAEMAYITIRRGAPINLDNKGNLDFVVKASSISLLDTGYDGAALFFYTLVSTKQDDESGGGVSNRNHRGFN